ncbi:MAG: hypothetical protein AAFY19_01535 [Pseudomonadota bacterium]
MAQLDPSAERECLGLLEDALSRPPAERRRWLVEKLEEREQVNRKLEDLLKLAERYNISL